MDNFVSLKQINNFPHNNTLVDYFLDYNDKGINVVLVGRFTGLRTMLHYSHIKDGLYKLNKTEKVVPKGKAPNVELITINY